MEVETFGFFSRVVVRAVGEHGRRSEVSISVFFALPFFLGLRRAAVGCAELAAMHPAETPFEKADPWAATHFALLVPSHIRFGSGLGAAAGRGRQQTTRNQRTTLIIVTISGEAATQGDMGGANDAQSST